MRDVHMNTKKWSLMLLILALVSLIGLGSITAIIDPFFHYHAPLPYLQYPIEEQRYQNDGISRHFEYDAIITGTSMSHKFFTSQCDALFGVKSIKVPYMGGSYTELNINLRRALESHPNTKLVICSLDSFHMTQAPGLIEFDAPLYLYDNNIFNDMPYLLNWEVLCNNTIEVLKYTRDGKHTTPFDQYSTGPIDNLPGREQVLKKFPREPISDEPKVFTQKLADQLTRNLMENTIQIAREYPDTQFLFFTPPYGILSWDSRDRTGGQKFYIDGWHLACRLLVEEPNIQVYSFFTEYDMITDLDQYYEDGWHYSAEINARILQWMQSGEHRLTKDNVDAYWQEVLDFYSSYDYDALFREVTANED